MRNSNTSMTIATITEHGLGDRAIHDAVQVIGYFNNITRLADAWGMEREEFIPPWGP